MNLFSQVKQNNNVRKTFSYSKDKVALEFILRIDVKNELRDFKQLLEAALDEVDQELIKHGG
jgi:hypothetical protein